MQLDPEKSYGLNGHLCVTEDYCPETLPAPFDLGEDITQNRVIMGSFLNPPHQKHLSRLMSGAEEEVRTQFCSRVSQVCVSLVDWTDDLRHSSRTGAVA